MLDYFTSEEGQQVLQAYREKRAEPAQVEASEAAPGRGLCGRQKISAAVRSNEGHYFAKAPKPEAPRPPKGKVSQKESEARPDKKEAPAPAEKTEVLGCVKSFSEDRGYGFLASEAAPGDIYFRAGDVPSDDAAQVGRYCSFTLHFKDSWRIIEHSFKAALWQHLFLVYELPDTPCCKEQANISTEQRQRCHQDHPPQPLDRKALDRPTKLYTQKQYVQQPEIESLQPSTAPSKPCLRQLVLLSVQPPEHQETVVVAFSALSLTTASTPKP